jgi:hypothetical protein
MNYDKPINCIYCGKTIGWILDYSSEKERFRGRTVLCNMCKDKYKETEQFEKDKFYNESVEKSGY